jgi:hypothetical protein
MNKQRILLLYFLSLGGRERKWDRKVPGYFYRSRQYNIPGAGAGGSKKSDDSLIFLNLCPNLFWAVAIQPKTS